MFVKSLLAGFICALALAAGAAASITPPSHSRPPHGKSCGPLHKYNRLTGQCVPIPPSSTTPVVTPPTTSPPLSTPPPVSPTPPLAQEQHEGYCVQTKERGETFVLAGLDSFKPGHDWYALWKAGATVVLDGHTVTLLYEDGKGLILAAKVPGVGLTCAQPYVSTDGVYANPSYGLR